MPFTSPCLYGAGRGRCDPAQRGVVCPEPDSPTSMLPVEASSGEEVTGCDIP